MLEEGDVRWVDNVAREGGPAVVISKTLADALFPDGGALGQQIMMRSDKAFTVVGIVDRAQAVYWSPFDQYTVFVAGREKLNQAYLVRIDRAQADGNFNQFKTRLMQSLNAKLESPGREIERQVDVQDMLTLKKSNLGRFIMINSIVGVVAVLLIVVTALGNYGQMSYTILKRTKQIGIRRALGATKTYVLNYFLVENALVSVLGMTFGVMLMLGLNSVIINAMGYGQLGAKHVVVSVVFMLLIGIGSALLPIRKAMSISPAIATKSI